MGDLRRRRFREERVIGILKEHPAGRLTKGEEPLEGLNDRILSRYVRGMTVPEFRGHVEEHYGFGVSSDLMSRVTDAVLWEVREWHNRPPGLGLSGGVLRCAAGEDPRRRRCMPKTKKPKEDKIEKAA